MKRYQLGALMLAMLVPACSKHHGSEQGTQRAAREAQQATAPAPQGVLPQGEQATTQAEGGWKQYDAADSEKLKLPAPSEKRGMATTSGGIVTTPPPSSAAARAPSYGNPPGTDTAPGTVRAVRPSQGATVPREEARGPDPESDADAAEDSVPTDADRRITQRVRAALRGNDSLSYTAKTVEIITRKGNITLKGMVLTDRERWEIERTARSYVGDGQVRNRLEIKNSMAPRN